jgi:FXSXX-COOH protein
VQSRKRFKAMSAADEKQTEITSDVRDLRDVPLALVRETEFDGIVRRILPDPQEAPRVSVAAFNSSI